VYSVIVTRKGWRILGCWIVVAIYASMAGKMLGYEFTGLRESYRSSEMSVFLFFLDTWFRFDRLSHHPLLKQTIDLGVQTVLVLQKEVMFDWPIQHLGQQSKTKPRLEEFVRLFGACVFGQSLFHELLKLISIGCRKAVEIAWQVIPMLGVERDRNALPIDRAW
jgi:hypothetical protein